MLVSEVIERTYSEFLYPSGVNRPTYDKLAAAINDTVTTFSVTGRVQNIPRDTVLEIDSELMLVDSVVGTTVNLHPTGGLGRGYLQTAAASHAQFAPVYVDPTYPRKTIFDTIVTIIGTLYPQGVYARVVSAAIPFTTSDLIDLPAGAKKALAVSTELDLGGGNIYANQLRKGLDWLEFMEYDPPKLQILRGGTEQGVMRIVYKSDFTEPTAESDQLDSLAAPIPARIQRYLPMAVAGYLLQGRDIGRIQTDVIVRQLATQGVQVGSSINLGNQMLNIFYARYVAPEADRLREQDNQGIEFVRR